MSSFLQNSTDINLKVQFQLMLLEIPNNMNSRLELSIQRIKNLNHNLEPLSWTMSLSSSQKKDKFKKKIEKFLHSKKNLRLEIQELLELETANSLLQAKQVSEEIA